MKRFAMIVLCCLFLAGCSKTTPSVSIPTNRPSTEPSSQETTAPSQTEPTASTPTQPTETNPTSPTIPIPDPDPEPEPEPDPKPDPVPDPEPEDPLTAYIKSMTLEERVGQIFLARCPEEDAVDAVRNYHLGGYVLFAKDFKNQTVSSVTQTIAQYQAAAKIPMLIAVDEEGGSVTRVSRYPAFRDTPFLSPRQLYEQGGMDAIRQSEIEKSQLLSSLGINVNLAPVCDITTNPDAFMYPRSLGESPEVTGQFVQMMLETQRKNGIGGVLKHFPGYGDNTDTHVAIAIDNRSLEELESRDLVPFRMGITGGAGAIMVSHTFINALDTEYPATLSPAVHRYIRQNMGFDGVLVTDDLVMQAITDLYGAEEAAVMAVLAGNDLLCSTEFQIQYEAVLQAVRDGRISQEIIDAAVRRILTWKIQMGLLTI